MLHHIVILRAEPYCFFPLPPSFLSFFVFVFFFSKENSFAALGYKNTEAQNLTPNFKNLIKYRVSDENTVEL